jgi:hypothetical protein
MTEDFRQPFAVVSSPKGDAHFVYCLDGSVWRRSVADGTWEELPPMPSTLRAAEREFAAAVAGVPS